MSTTLQNGSVLYQYPDAPTEVTLNGVSVLDLNPEEIKVWPDGWGYVLTQKELGKAGVAVKEWLDGQTRNHQYWGQIAAIF